MTDDLDTDPDILRVRRLALELGDCIGPGVRLLADASATACRIEIRGNVEFAGSWEGAADYLDAQIERVAAFAPVYSSADWREIGRTLAARLDGLVAEGHLSRED